MVTHIPLQTPLAHFLTSFSPISFLAHLSWAHFLTSILCLLSGYDGAIPVDPYHTEWLCGPSYRLYVNSGFSLSVRSSHLSSPKLAFHSQHGEAQT